MLARGYDPKSVKFVFTKSPDYGKSAVVALKYLSRPKVIIIVRDPHYAIDSLKKSREMRGEKLLHLFNFFDEIINYKLLHRVIKDASVKANSEKVKLIRYEDLVSDPERYMKELSDFIGIGYDKKMLEPTLNGEKWHGESSFRIFDGISTSEIKRGIKTLTEWEMNYIDIQIKDFLNEFGYV